MARDPVKEISMGLCRVGFLRGHTKTPEADNVGNDFPYVQDNLGF